MAKHNDVFLYGQVLADPKITKNDETGEYVRGFCPILVIRGVRNYGGKDIKHIGFDKPNIISGNSMQIEKMSHWQKGDMVEIKGAITTKDVNKISICKHCGARNSNRGVVIFVSPIYTKVIEKGKTVEEGTELMKESCEISNQTHIIGMLCREPTGFHHDEKNLDITNYQLAVSRKFHILEDSSDNRVDFPWIKSYGAIARDDYKYLRKGSYVLVDGMIQTRNIKRNITCSECGQEYEYNETVIDIVPYSTEYLRNFRTEEELASQEAKERADAITEVFSEEDIKYPVDTPVIPDEMQNMLKPKK